MSDMEYRGRGRFLVGVPARDLSDEEFQRLPAVLRERVQRSSLYRAVRPVKAAKAAGKESEPNV